MLANAIQEITQYTLNTNDHNKESFVNDLKNELSTQYSSSKMTATLIATIIVMIIIVFLGKYLWNTVLVDLVPGVKKATSAWQILGMYVLLNLLFGR
jgi:hypothetical protein